MLRVAVVMLIGCANVHVNRIAIATSTLAIACDWGQTRQSASRYQNMPNWTAYEANPILGGHPTTTDVDLYFLSAVALNAAAWLLLPSKYRSIVGIVAVTETVQAIDNLPVATLCGM